MTDKLINAGFGLIVFAASCGLVVLDQIEPAHWVTVTLATVWAVICGQAVTALATTWQVARQEAAKKKGPEGPL